ncbi:helix-turn-helix domain-containing protein [Paenibacillus chungangensis]|uniref:Helix-turn-helix domain-containing protein n=1 Tax=Paenibacillus chungangensis TaxID=696535 RepID=A0ABW3HQ76_9BACL
MEGRSIFVKWLLSYLLILLIPISVSVVVMTQAEKIVDNEVKRTNSALIEQTRQVADAQLKDWAVLHQLLVLDSKVNGFLGATNPLTEFERYNVVQLSKQLKTLYSAHLSLYDIYLYFHESEMIISPSGTYKAQVLYEQIHRYEGMSFSEWKQQVLIQAHHQQVVPMTVHLGGSREKALLLSRSVPSRLDAGATLVLVVAESKLQELLNLDVYGGEMLIIDSSNQLIASSGHTKKLKYDDIPKDGWIVRSIQGKKFVLSSRLSERGDWKYVSLVPRDVFLEKVMTVKRLLLASIFICMILGLPLSYKLVRRQYLPVSRIIGMLDRQDRKERRRVDEFAYIEEAISGVRLENNDLRLKMEGQRPLLQIGMIHKLLKGNWEVGSSELQSIVEWNKIAGGIVEFCSEQFAVMLFRIEASSSEHTAHQPRLQVATTFIVTNVLEELIKSEHQGHIVDLDEHVVCLVNFTNIKDEEAAEAFMLQVAEHANTFLMERYNISFIAGVSDLHHGISEISVAYEEAQHAIESALLVANAGYVLTYSRLPSRASSYHYSLAIEQKLMNCVKSGDNEKVQLIIKEMIGETFVEEGLPLPLAKCLFFDMMSTALKLSDELSYMGNDEWTRTKDEALSNLLASTTVPDMMHQLLEVFTRMCIVVQKHRNTESGIQDEIATYVNQNYTDPNLSISSIAEHFGMNGAYLSRIFKERLGISLHDYITKLRISCVKKLLQTAELTLNDIAEQTGYTNANTLIRSFKKYEGITPGQYKLTIK